MFTGKNGGLTKGFKNGTLSGMKYNFKKFERDDVRGEAQISISRASALRFSAKFCKVTDIMTYIYVTLFYDTPNKTIAILPTNKQDKGTFKITKEKTSGSVSITSFMNAYKLNPEVFHGRYNWTKETIPNIGEVYIITLKK